jgi:hypothetical protein
MSTIDDTSIDQTFPVAGQDNNSQGFRDNFSTIKNNFTKRIPLEKLLRRLTFQQLTEISNMRLWAVT